MSHDQTLVFQVFVPAVPELFSKWRPGGESKSIDRHYAIGPDHQLFLAGSERVVLQRFGSKEGFRTETDLLDATFPLDWMSCHVIASALPRSLRHIEIDGRSPEAFVEALGTPDLLQAEVRKETRRVILGSTVAEASRILVPEWNTTSVAVAFRSVNPHALRAAIAAAGLSTRQHETLETFLRTAHGAAPPAEPAPRPRRFFRLPAMLRAG